MLLASILKRALSAYRLQQALLQLLHPHRKKNISFFLSPEVAKLIELKGELILWKVSVPCGDSIALLASARLDLLLLGIYINFNSQILSLFLSVDSIQDCFCNSLVSWSCLLIRLQLFDAGTNHASADGFVIAAPSM